MQTHGNLTASYLWQPGELARRMLGERPSPVPPTRDIWPPPRQPLSISTLHVAYLQDEPVPRRAATLPPQTYAPTTIPLEHEHQGHSRPRVCTVGTNTDPPLTVLGRLRRLVKKDEHVPTGHPPPGRLTAVPRETALDVKEDDNAAKRALNGIRKAISGAKYRIAPGSEIVDSPKIVYDMPKPGDRMTTTFGVRESRKWLSLPSSATCSRKIRSLSEWCRPRPQRPPKRQPQPRLQITQV
ncbi:uncharacterized protein LOC128674973 [Plodia interpunctella]|uniref:uncharacterized protein LOC128674973 n=1 Tax=Plodia interpunctella TaxID=58824 RepID=UPI00236794AD|nr:uncharacterized protein LOC128674973 [Plodia interpunctella]